MRGSKTASPASAGSARGRGTRLPRAMLETVLDRNARRVADGAVGSGKASVVRGRGKIRAGSSKTWARPASTYAEDAGQDEDTTGSESESAQSGSDRRDRFEATTEQNRYVQLKPEREEERKQAIRSGLIPDPDKRHTLDEAITFVGTCMDMCPAFEREEREYQKNVDKLELTPGTNRIDASRAVKAFHRPAAGNEQPLPSDVRPPEVLKLTLDYLFETVLASDPGLSETHPFIRDRTRSIRQDFTMQHERGPIAIECHERIARYHILCLHVLRDRESFSESQELEQLRKVLQSLNEFYEDALFERMDCPNEAEFRSYSLIVHLRDSDVIRQTEALPARLFDSQSMQTALRLHSLAQRNNDGRGRRAANSEACLNHFTRFFKLLQAESTTFLLACLCESHFSDIRRGALKAMMRSNLSNLPPYPLAVLTRMLGFDSTEECADFCVAFGLGVIDDAVELNRSSSFTEFPALIPMTRSERIVGIKQGLTTFEQILSASAIMMHSSPPPPSKPSPLRAAAPIFVPRPAAKITPPRTPLVRAKSKTPPIHKSAAPSLIQKQRKSASPPVQVVMRDAVPLHAPDTSQSSPIAFRTPQRQLLEPQTALASRAPLSRKSPTVSPHRAVVSKDSEAQSVQDQIIEELADLMLQRTIHSGIHHIVTQAVIDLRAARREQIALSRAQLIEQISEDVVEEILGDYAHRHACCQVLSIAGARRMRRAHWSIWRASVKRALEARQKARQVAQHFSDVSRDLPVNTPVRNMNSADARLRSSRLEINDKPLFGEEENALSLFWQRGTFLAPLIAWALHLQTYSSKHLQIAFVVDSLLTSSATFWRCKLGMAPECDVICIEEDALDLRISLVDSEDALKLDDQPLVLLVVDSDSAELCARIIDSLIGYCQFSPAVIVSTWTDQPDIGVHKALHTFVPLLDLQLCLSSTNDGNFAALVKALPHRLQSNEDSVPALTYAAPSLNACYLLMPSVLNAHLDCSIGVILSVVQRFLALLDAILGAFLVCAGEHRYTGIVRFHRLEPDDSLMCLATYARSERYEDQDECIQASDRIAEALSQPAHLQTSSAVLALDWLQHFWRFARNQLNRMRISQNKMTGLNPHVNTILDLRISETRQECRKLITATTAHRRPQTTKRPAEVIDLTADDPPLGPARKREKRVSLNTLMNAIQVARSTLDADPTDGSVACATRRGWRSFFTVSTLFDVLYIFLVCFAFHWPALASKKAFGFFRPAFLSLATMRAHEAALRKALYDMTYRPSPPSPDRMGAYRETPEATSSIQWENLIVESFPKHYPFVDVSETTAGLDCLTGLARNMAIPVGKTINETLSMTPWVTREIAALGALYVQRSILKKASFSALFHRMGYGDSLAIDGAGPSNKLMLLTAIAYVKFSHDGFARWQFANIGHHRHATAAKDWQSCTFMNLCHGFVHCLPMLGYRITLTELDHCATVGEAQTLSLCLKELFSGMPNSTAR
ncbi:uncharacterized protein L969DRAFT_42828 [Mixia osmundae IAM 14324]|uniref:SAC3/GANP/THP3 conserved domain-containing protein n=1 Tax=Mixia osmundae (strain CBS 9802 / IAM 14324 / JCM 22182 / KY 12970) TaxID=764103 RepID=G7E3T3_MIXOS|nr:uncharacterized protein L969DRAFT_42828 [Mixia osmundae IAM 14324]KEI41938.1 hypothetical protein L969DRAFT_42828 [Mixia osmundae IAM 14324]GAA97493.1 hypothetical protein E5Q_04171 [Mixia osmundae IAM 14324]